MTNKIVIIGLGQTLRGDDAAGLEAVRLWERTYPTTATHPQVRVEYAESPGLTLLSLLEGADEALLVDAVQSNAPPGSIHLLREADLPAFLQGASSAHGWSIAETLAIGRRAVIVDLPEQVSLLGIELAQTEMGAGLSPAVQQALPEVALTIERHIHDWLAKEARR